MVRDDNELKKRIGCPFFSFHRTVAENDEELKMEFKDQIIDPEIEGFGENGRPDPDWDG